MTALWVMGTATTITVYFPNLVNFRIFFVERRILESPEESLFARWQLSTNPAAVSVVLRLATIPCNDFACYQLLSENSEACTKNWQYLLCLAYWGLYILLKNPNLCFKNWCKLRCLCTAFQAENLAFKSIFHAEVCVDFVYWQFSQSV